MQNLTPGEFVTAWAIATVAAVWVFLDASRKESRHPTWWGIGVFLCLIVFLPTYLLHRRYGRRRPRA